MTSDPDQSPSVGDAPLATTTDQATAEKPRRGVKLFSSTSGAERVRRPTDAVLLGLGGLVILITAIASDSSTGVEASATLFIDSLPGALDSLWRMAADFPLVWSLALVVIAIVADGRNGLVRDQILAGVLAGVGSMACYWVVEDSWPSVEAILGTDPPASYPAGRLAVAVGVIVTSSPHLSRPLRSLGRWVLFFGVVGTVFMHVATPGGTIAALVVGSMAAAATHLVFGSPGGRPSVNDVATSLLELGVHAADLRPAELQPAGAWTVLGTGADGEPLVIKVYGRDAWDTQFVTQLWRFLWYRHSSTGVRPSRDRQVEHEGLMLLLAKDASLTVPKVRAAGRSLSGDALIVVQPVDEADTRGQVAALWSALLTAHGAGLSPCSISVDDLGWTAAGGGVISSWAGGTTAPDEAQRQQDRAQLMVATMLMTSSEEALDAAVDALGNDEAAKVVPYLQPSCVPAAERRRADHVDKQIEAMRTEMSTRLGIEQVELVQVHRVTKSSIIQAGLLVLAASALVTGLAGLDFASVADEVRDLTIGAVILCLLLGQVARASGAISTYGASPTPLPIGPLVQLQFAIAYINLAVPSSVGRLAMNMRFFQRAGASKGAAVGVGTVDGAANFVVQIGLMVVILGFGLGSLELDLTSAIGDTEGDSSRLLLIVLLVLVVGVILVLTVPKLRAKVMPAFADVKEGLHALSSPSKVAMVVGGDALTQVIYGMTMCAAASATGFDVSLADAVLINTVVSVFAGLIPVPGGIGVSEAGITAGLVAVGMTEPAALCAALLHRVMTAYAPPVWGWFAMRSLTKKSYL